MSPAPRQCVDVVVGTSLAQWPGFWTYWTHIPDLAVDDWVIVEAPHDEHGKKQFATGIPVVARVVNLKPAKTRCERSTRWIVDRIDWDKYRALQALAPPEPKEE